MAGLIDIGKTAINAQRQALNVTGQNIANVNTEGYRKRTAEMEEVSGSQSELTSLTAQMGLGVNLGVVRRAYNAYLSHASNVAESRYESATEYVKIMELLENRVLPSEGDLAHQISEFFARLADISANPGDLAPRAAAIEQAHGLSDSFVITSQLLTDLETQLRGSIEQEVSKVNLLVDSLETLNSRLLSSNFGDSPPNALLDERDRLVREISKKVMVSTEYGARHDVTLTIGRYSKGPVLLAGEKSEFLDTAFSETSGVVFQLGDDFASKSLDDGILSGLSKALGVVSATSEKLDLLASRFISDVNSVHRSGVDFEGDVGRDIFTARQFTVTQSPDNSREHQIDILEVPGEVDQLDELNVVYNAGTGFWEARDRNNDVVGTGRKEINLGGLVVQINSQPTHGDSFRLLPETREASRMKFLLKDGKKIAAAANFVTTPGSTNTGSANVITKHKASTLPPLPKLNDLTTNNISPVAYTEFLSDGAVAYIPANISSIDLASFGQSSYVEYNFSDEEGMSAFELKFGSPATTHRFPSSATATVMARINKNSKEIAEYLNDGVIKSDSGKSLKDLGLFAAGSDSGIKISGSSSFAAGTLTLQKSGKTNAALVKVAEEASSFKVFTREGRQVAGVPLSTAESESLITEENGFHKDAVYRADYLNPVGGKGYRGAKINNLLPGGYSVSGIDNAISLLTNNDLTKLVKQSPALNNIGSQNLTFKTTDGLVESSVKLDAGLSMKSISRIINEKVGEFGIMATSRTMASVELASSAGSSGTATFDIITETGDVVPISASFQAGKLNPLKDQINKMEARTGIRAEISRDGKKLILIQEQGEDIVLRKTTGAGLEVNSLDTEFNKLLTNNIALGNLTKVVGTISFQSPREFTTSSNVSGSTTTISSAPTSIVYGGIDREVTEAGTVNKFEIEVPRDVMMPQSSPSGLRIFSTPAEFSLKAPMNGAASPALSVTLKSNDLIDPSPSNIADSLIKSARKMASIPSVEGALLAALPDEGSKMAFKVGASEYMLRYAGGDFSVTGPEEGRILATKTIVTGTAGIDGSSQSNFTAGTQYIVTKAPTGSSSLSVGSIFTADGSADAEAGMVVSEFQGYKVSLAAPGGVMSSTSIGILNNTDATKFGLSTTNANADLKLQGRSFNLEGLSLSVGQAKSFDSTIGEDIDGSTQSNFTTGKRYLVVTAATSGTPAKGAIFTSDGSDSAGGLVVRELAQTTVSRSSSGYDFSSNNSNLKFVIPANGTNSNLTAVTAGGSGSAIVSSPSYGATIADNDTFTLAAVSSAPSSSGIHTAAFTVAGTSYTFDAFTHGVSRGFNTATTTGMGDALKKFINEDIGSFTASYSGTTVTVAPNEKEVTSYSINASNSTIDGSVQSNFTKGKKYIVTTAATSGTPALSTIITANGSTDAAGGMVVKEYAGDTLISLSADLKDGPLVVRPSTESAALGFKVTTFDFELTDKGFEAVSTTSEKTGVDLAVSGLSGQILSLSDLPPEDLLVVIGKEGARRLGASFELATEEEMASVERNYQVKVTDGSSNKVELIEKSTGASIATRYSKGAEDFAIDNFRIELTGFADHGDFFDVTINKSSPGDGRNIQAIMDLNKTTDDRDSFQDDFRNIALSVGSQLVSSRLIEKSATSLRDAAIEAEDELTGVNLDEEASALLEQQQAYKAAAQILQAAREMFETVVSIM